MTKGSSTPARGVQVRCSAIVAVVALSLFCYPPDCTATTSWQLVGHTAYAPASQGEDSRELVPDSPIQRELQSGDLHVYKINLAAGDYLRVYISATDKSKGEHSNVKAQFVVPGGMSAVQAFLAPNGGARWFISYVSEFSGDCRLEIHLNGSEAEPERYEIRIDHLRPATDKDRSRVKVEGLEEEGRRFVNYIDTAEQRRQGVAKYEQALTLWRELGERDGELRMLSRLGFLYDDSGELQKVLAYGQQAIEISRKVGDRYQEANLLVSIGVAYTKLGENQKALDTLYQAKRIFKEVSKRYGEALAGSNIGVALLYLGEWQSARPYVEEALATFSSVGDTDAEANALNMLGAIHRALGEKQKAIEFHNRALAIARAGSQSDREATSLGHLGGVYFELGDKQKALECFEEELKKCQTLGKSCEGDSLKGIGDLAFSMGDNQKALDYLNRSLVVFQSTWERPREAKTLHSLAQVNYSLGKFEDARRQLEKAIEIEESMRAKVISRQFREDIFTSAQSSFGLYVDVLMELHKKNPAAGYEAAALKASERARARSLLEVLAESRAEIREGVPGNLLELERTLQQQINSKAAARTRFLSDKHTHVDTGFLDKEIAELTARYGDVEVQIRQSSPRYAALTQPQPLSAPAIQQQLDDNTVLLEFALGEKQSWLWAVTPAAINSYQLPAIDRIEPSARRAYDLLTARQPRKGETDPQYQARIREADASFQTESAMLSEMLLGPIASNLQREWKDKRLVIVAPGALEYLPFAALPLPASKSAARNARIPLVAQHEIVNLPSASALAAIRNETSGRKVAEMSVAVLADPVFEFNDPRVLGALRKTARNNSIVTVRSGEAQATSLNDAPSSASSETTLTRSLRSFNRANDRGGFSRLPFSREEAEAISSLAPKTSSMKETDFQASLANATNGELSNYRIIHFATHGLLNSEHPELSGLVLSLVDENGKSQDGFLRMNEIYNLKLPADLIVLSACQTALGKEIKGEGLVGLTRGFMYAGAQRVVASLWQVDDLATAELMKSFYRGILKDGMRPAQALRFAQLELLKQQRWSSPYFWAPFVIQGEWR